MGTFNDLVYFLVIGLFRILTGVFFRDIVTRNSHAIPKKGPVIFVAAPHANQFVDPMILIETCQRKVRFLTAAVSMRKWYIGLFGRLLNSIPVERPMDLAILATGKIYRKQDDFLKIHGEGTEFESEAKVGLALMVKVKVETFTAQIEEIISDSEIRIKKPFDPAAEQVLLEGTPFKYVPVLDQSHVYTEVIETLARGEAVVIFPEGGSHDRAEMLPLKAGVSLMALGAMAKYPDLEVAIVPCGLNYFHPHQFRSRAVIEYGRPFVVDRSLAEEFSKGGDARREACSTLLNHIYHSLLDVTINVPDFETLQLIQAVRRLYRPTSRILSTSEQLDLTKRLVKGYMQHKDNPRVKKVKEEVLEYNKLLRYHGLMDHQVRNVAVSRLGAFGNLVIHLLVFLVFGLASLPGIVLNAPALIVIDLISKRAAIKSKAGSSVKIDGRDVLATWKLIVGLLLLPALDIGYTSVLAYELWIHGFEVRFILKLGLLVLFLVLPLLTLMTLKFSEIGYESIQALSPLWFSILLPDRGQFLQKKRRALRMTIKDLVNQLGPTVFENFESGRIIKRRQSDATTSNARALPVAKETPSKIETALHFIDSAISKYRNIRASLITETDLVGLLNPESINWANLSDTELNSVFFKNDSPREPPSKKKSD